jgi:hypothetical protein
MSGADSVQSKRPLDLPSNGLSLQINSLLYRQLLNLKLAMRVFQLKLPFAGRYSVVYHNVQSSTGSTLIEL